jgi:hypothetical protein
MARLEPRRRHWSNEMSIDTQTDSGNSFDFDPACDPEHVADLENAAQEWGVNRRIAFVLAAKSRSELTDVARSVATNDEAALFEMLDGIRGLIEHYQSSAELFSAVEARLLVAARDAFDVPLD